MKHIARIAWKPFLVVALFVSVLSGGNYEAMAQAKASKITKAGFLQVDFNMQPHDDTKLGRALLKNVIDEAKKSVDKEPYLAAKLVQFQGLDGKSMLFVSVAHPYTCLRSTCKVYVLIKKGKDSNWQWGFDTFAFDAYIDTKKQQTEFPRILTLMTDNSSEYWVWDNNKYRKAG